MKNLNLLFYFKLFAVITFGSGILLHASRLYFGAEYFLKHILNLNNDRLFSLPMLATAILAWVSFKEINLDKFWLKITYIIIAVYTSISVPVHIKSWFTNDLNQLEAFPENYSIIIIPIIFSMLVFVLSLKNKSTEK